MTKLLNLLKRYYWWIFHLVLLLMYIVFIPLSLIWLFPLTFFLFGTYYEYRHFFKDKLRRAKRLMKTKSKIEKKL